MFGVIQQLPMMVMAIFSLPQGRMVVIAVLLLVVAAAASRRFWAQCLIAILLFALSAAASVWVLQFGWALAAVGILLVISGILWKLIGSGSSSKSHPERAHASGGLIWPGLGLLAAPFANVFVLMPALRSFFTRARTRQSCALTTRRTRTRAQAPCPAKLIRRAPVSVD